MAKYTEVVADPTIRYKCNICGYLHPTIDNANMCYDTHFRIVPTSSNYTVTVNNVQYLPYCKYPTYIEVESVYMRDPATGTIISHKGRAKLKYKLVEELLYEKEKNT